MDGWHGISNTTRSWTATSAVQDYKERVSYDDMGNILSYLRNGTTAQGNLLAMDTLKYLYNANTNQLNYVRDSVAASNYAGTIDIDPNQSPNNYQYEMHLET